MKKWLVSVILVFASVLVYGQQDTFPVKDTSLYKIISYDGVEYIGQIVSSDPREVLLMTADRGLIYIPQYVIREILIVKAGEYTATGKYIGEDVFATRYFLTTNGFPLKKGESYIQWNLYGPDFQFGLGRNFGVGIMSTWVGVPVIGTLKYSIPLKANLNASVGFLGGTGSWGYPEMGLVLPFGSLTYGNRRNNISISGGYGYYADENSADGRALFSVGSMFKTGKKFSFIFDSFIMLPGDEREVEYTYTTTDYNATFGFYETVEHIGTKMEKRPGSAIIVPGIRWHIDNNRAFQFGFAGIYAEGEFQQIPIPMIQWYRKL